MAPNTLEACISLLARAPVSLKSTDAVSPAVQQLLEDRCFWKDTNNMRDLFLEPQPLGRHLITGDILFFTLDSDF